MAASFATSAWAAGAASGCDSALYTALPPTSLRNVSMRSGIGSCTRRNQTLEKGADAVARQFACDDLRVADPIHLDDTALTVKRCKAVPGVRAVAEDNKCAFRGRNFGRVIVEI